MFCPLCELEKEVKYLGGYRSRHQTFASKDLYQCLDCELIFVHPMPTSAELDWYYKNVWIKDEATVSTSKETEIVYQIQSEERLKYLSQHIDLSKVMKVLDIGSGFGYLFDAFERHGVKRDAFYATDPSPENLERLKAKGSKAFSDLKEIKERDFDLVTLCYVLEHINEPYKFMLSVMDYVRGGGYIFLDLPERDDTFKPVLEPHVAVYSVASLRKLADKLGLEVIHLTGYGTKRSKLIEQGRPRRNILSRLINAASIRLEKFRRKNTVNRLYRQYEFGCEGADRWWIRAVLKKK